MRAVGTSLSDIIISLAGDVEDVAPILQPASAVADVVSQKIFKLEQLMTSF